MEKYPFDVTYEFGRGFAGEVGVVFCVRILSCLEIEPELTITHDHFIVDIFNLININT